MVSGPRDGGGNAAVVDPERLSNEKESSSSPPPPAPAYNVEVPCPPHTTERKLLMRIDFKVIPWLCIMYLLAFLDRVNIANANVFGLSEELHLDGTLYNNALVVFFVPYILFEIPSNILVKRFRPHVWLSINMAGFGLVTLLQGFVTNYAGLVTTRFFLGAFESVMFPASFYLIGMWYRRSEAQKRYSFFFSSTTLAGAFGGLIAAGIGKMAGAGGYAGWRWIFILEGALTVVVSFFFYFLLPDFPEEAKWLTEEERAFVTARLRIDQGNSAADRKITLRDVGRVFKDYKVIVAGVMYFGLIVPDIYIYIIKKTSAAAYGYAYFAPSIISSYGYSPIQTQLHSVPPWVAAFGFSMLFAVASDRTRHRFGFAIFAILIAITGFGILLGVRNNTNVQYAGLFLIVMGAYTAMPIIVCWFNMNLGGHHRRAVGSAWQVGFGNIGGIIAVYTFLKRDAPLYIPGYSICIAFTTLSIIACTIYALACVTANKKRAKEAQSSTPEENAELGDLSPSYRYLL